MTMYHISLDIDGSLKRSNKQLDGILSNGERDLTGDEVKDFLRSEKDKGYTRFYGCDNRSADGGCAGHAEE